MENTENCSDQASSGTRSTTSSHQCPAAEQNTGENDEEGEQDEENNLKFFAKSQNRKTVTKYTSKFQPSNQIPIYQTPLWIVKQKLLFR